MRLRQLDDIVKWTKEFRSESQDDAIVFDVVAGDFNFDNTSPGEVISYLSIRNTITDLSNSDLVLNI